MIYSGFFRSVILAALVGFSSAAMAANDYNLALNKTTTAIDSVSGSSPGLAVDGNTNGVYNSTHSIWISATTNAGNWWEVDLGDFKYIDTIELYNRTDACCSGYTTDFYVFVSNMPFVGTTIADLLTEDGVTNFHETGTMGTPSVFSVGAAGRHVRIMLASANYFNVAEVKVMGDDFPPNPSSPTDYNLARATGVTASAKSYAFGGTVQEAIDGFVTTNFTGGTFSGYHSSSTAAENWYQVDLGEVKFIDSINAYGRTDCCHDRDKNYHIFVSEEPFTGTTVASSIGQTGVHTYSNTGEMEFPSTVSVGRPGRYVRVQLVGNNYLSLAELEVIGDDPDPSMAITKVADDTTDVNMNQNIIYTYQVTNDGNMPLTNVTTTDVHDGLGTPPVPSSEVLTDNSPTGDSYDDTSNDGIWTKLGPGDVVTLTGNYTVISDDIAERQ